MDLKWKYLQILYKETHDISWQKETQYIHGDILFQYILFREEHYYRLGLNYPYDIHIVMQLLNLSRLMQRDLFNRPRSNAKFHDIPSYQYSAATQLMKRFVEFLNTNDGKQYYIKFKNNEKYFFVPSHSDKDINITHHFMDYTYLLDVHTLKRAEIEAKLKEGHDIKDIDTGSYDVTQLQTTLIEFDKKKNPTHFGLNDEEISVFVKVRNVEDILVKLFEINTKSYYRDNNKAISTALNLDGLCASYEWSIKHSDIDLNTPYHEKEIVIQFPKELVHKRGVYFLDLLSNGIHSRSIINIGNIKYITKVCEAGHLFTLLDENNERIRNGSILLNKHIYKTSSETHCILIPFTNNPNQKQNIILQRNDDANFNVISSFHHESESYVFECGFYIDRQQILSKRKAVILVRCGLFLNDKQHRISLNVIQNTKLMLRLSTAHKDVIDIDKVYEHFKLFNDRESIVTIDIPDQLRSITITLKCEIEKISTTNPRNKIQKFTKTQTFAVNGIDDTFTIAQLFLIPQMDDAYIIALYGRNGEAISNQKLSVDLYPKYIDSQVTYITITDLYTDVYGRVYLPNLQKRFHKLRVNVKDPIQEQKTWDLEIHTDYVKIASILNILSGESVSIPYIATMTPRFALFDYYYIKQYDDTHLEYDEERSSIVISNLASGKYILKILDLGYDVRINVVEKGRMLEMDNTLYNIHKNEITSLSTPNKLQIQHIDDDIDNMLLKIQLNGMNERTRVHVIGAHLLPSFDIEKLLYRDMSEPDEKRTFLSTETNYYLDQREIDEEYRYVLEREQSPKYPGNSLIRPSFLVKPLEIGGTITATQNAAGGGQFHDESVGEEYYDADKDDLEGTPERFKRKPIAISTHTANMDFLSENGSVIVYNLVPDSDGVVTVDIRSMYTTNQNFIRVIAFDEEDNVMRTHCLTNRKTRRVTVSDDDKNDIEYNVAIFDQYVDNRMMVGLNPLYQYVDGYDIILLNKSGDNYTVNDFKSSQIEIYSNFDEIFDLLYSISHNELLTQWSFLKTWHSLNDDEKLTIYDSFLSHELHLFLMENDAVFFNNVCVIHIKSKLYKDFMDHYFLQDYDELIKYLDIAKLDGLSIVEQILFAHFLTNDKRNDRGNMDILKYAQYNTCYDPFTYDSLQIDRKRFNKLFEAALNKKLIMATATGAHKPTGTPSDQPTLSPSKHPSIPPLLAPSKAPSLSPSAAPSRRRTMDERSDGFAFGSYAKERGKMRKKKYFEQIHKTKEYKETSFWSMKYKTNFVSLNAFWCDFALSILNDEKKDKAFLSARFMIATSSVNEMLFALSLLDIPFNDDDDNNNNNNNNIESVHNDAKDWNHNVTLITSTPSILFIKQLQKASIAANDDEMHMKSVLIYSHYFDPNDKYQEHQESKIKKEKFIESDAFFPGKIYGVSVILISVVSYEQKLNILTQIPTGSIPIGRNCFRTKTHIFTLSPYSVQKFEYFFYFPNIGSFQIYPIIVSYQSTQEILSSFNVNNQENNEIMVKYSQKTSDTVTNIESWNDVSLNGNYDEILQYLSSHNLYEISLSRIYYKLSKSMRFYDNVIDLLRNKYFYDDVIWAFQLFWIKESTKLNGDLQQRLEILLEYISIHYKDSSMNPNPFDPYYKSSAFVYDSMEHHKYDYKEYIPLVNARKYVLGQQRSILNNKLKTQYESFLSRCSYQSASITTLPFNELISATYYLLLQDRVDEAMAVYNIITYKSKSKSNTDNYDIGNPLYSYFVGYMSLYQYDDYANIIAVISDITKEYCNISLIPSKRTLFDEFDLLLQDLMNINNEKDINDNSGSDDTETNNKLQFDDEEFIKFEINEEDKFVIVESQNVDEFDINFYPINMEVLFSMNPSLVLPSSQSSESKNKIFSYIKPKESISVHVSSQDVDGITENQVAIPDELKNENVFIQIVSSTMIVSKPYNDHQLIVQVQQNKGKLKILTRNKNDKLMFVDKAYIKVYSKIKNANNEYQFYKDGYSDVRGLFDYISLSTDDLDHTEKFVFFIKHGKYGCTVQEANTPTR